MKTLFVLSGGGMRGLDILAGQLAALGAAGIRPDAICGTSAGAVIAALAATGYAPATICGIVSGLRDRDVRRERFMWKPRALWIDHFLEHAPIRKLLQRLLPADVAELKMPYSCVTTRTSDGAEIVWSSRILAAAPADVSMSGLADWRECVLASMSISGIFPWVDLQGAEYADGGVRANLPLPSNWTMYDQVYLLVASHHAKFAGRRRSIVSRLVLNAEWYALDQIADVFSRIRRVQAKYESTPRVVALFPPPLSSRGGMLRFDHGLIQSAREAATISLQTPRQLLEQTA